MLYGGYRWYWMPPLVWSLVSANTSTLHRCFMTLFTGCQSLWGYSSRLLLWPSTVTKVLVLSTSSKSSAQSRICHIGHSVRLAAVTCSFRGRTRPSASEVSPLRLLSSGTHFHLTSAHHTSVAGFSNRSWRLTFSNKPTTLHDSWEQFFVEECNSVTVTVTILCVSEYVACMVMINCYVTVCIAVSVQWEFQPIPADWPKTGGYQYWYRNNRIPCLLDSQCYWRCWYVNVNLLCFVGIHLILCLYMHLLLCVFLSCCICWYF